MTSRIPHPARAGDRGTGLTARTETSAALLDGVDLTVRAGQVTALVGPSGSGKTTTALALLGEAPRGVRLAGSVRVAGVSVVDADGVTARAPAVRGGTLAYMPQHPGDALTPPAAWARSSPSWHGSTGRRRPGRGRPGPARGGPRARRRRAAAGAAPARAPSARRFPHQFSGGQRQRVALAQVLACGPGPSSWTNPAPVWTR
ncbi:ATP-binding cassette domain-containing protein [Streptomyces sp. M19]